MTRRRSSSQNRSPSDESTSAEEPAGASGGGPFSLPSFSHSSGQFNNVPDSTAVRHRRDRRQLKKSSSLTDFHQTVATAVRTDQAVGPRSLSSFLLACNEGTVASANRTLPATEPSSSSSCGTGGSSRLGPAAVPQLRRAAAQSLSHDDDLMPMAQPSRYSSRRSISNSFETVVGANRIGEASSGKESLGKHL